MVQSRVLVFFFIFFQVSLSKCGVGRVTFILYIVFLRTRKPFLFGKSHLLPISLSTLIM